MTSPVVGSFGEDVVGVTGDEGVIECGHCRGVDYGGGTGLFQRWVNGVVAAFEERTTAMAVD